MRFIMNGHMGLTTGYRIFWDNLRLSCLDKGFELPLYPIGCMVPRIIWGLLPFLSFAAAVDQRKSIYGSSNFVVSWQNIFYLLRREVEIFQKKNHKNIFFFFWNTIQMCPSQSSSAKFPSWLLISLDGQSLFVLSGMANEPSKHYNNVFGWNSADMNISVHVSAWVWIPVNFFIVSCVAQFI